MTTSELIEQAFIRTYECLGRVLPAMGAHAVLANGDRVGVSLVRPQGRSRRMRAHVRATFHHNGKTITREQAESLLASQGD